nr:hypothetical protein [Tanacetum cinerariifolium]
MTQKHGVLYKHSAILGKSHGIRNLPGSPSFSSNFFRRTVEQYLEKFLTLVVSFVMELLILESGWIRNRRSLVRPRGTNWRSNRLIDWRINWLRVALVSHSTTGDEEVVGIMGPGYAVPLLVVIPFGSSFRLVIMLPGRVLDPKDEAAEESGIDELELGKPKVDKMVLGKLEVGFDLG